MSNQPEPNPNGGNNNPDRFQMKPFFIWFILLTVFLFLMMGMPGQNQNAGQQLSIPQLIAYAQDGQVETLNIKQDGTGGSEWYQVWGKMQNPEYSDEPVEAEQAQESTDLPPQYIDFTTEGRLTSERFALLEAAIPADQFNEEPASTLWREILVGLLPFIFIIALLYFLFIRQLRSAGKGAMSFGKSKAKMLTRDKERALFKDVAGCDEAKEELEEVVEFLRNPKKFQQIGGRVPKGVMMVGPPGTGKTLLAKAIAGEADVPFFSISGSDFVEMFVGVGAARVRDMFEQGRRHAPCIIFVDEIDAVGRQRGAGLGGGNDEREQTLNSLLVEMDGFDTQEGIILIAATNRPDVLDQALTRPGRFDRQVVIDMPDLNGREEILKVHAKKIKLGKDVDLQRVARSTPGFSGADLANLLNESALLAARYNKKEVAMIDIEEARDKIAYGRERRKLMDDEDKRLTAFHEAGHALVKALLKEKKSALHKVTIIPRGRALGMTMYTPTKDILGYSKHELLNFICMAMAGRIGEEVETGDFSNGAMGDIKQATAIARQMVCDWGMSALGPVALGDNQDHIFLAREITRSQNYSEETARMIDAEIRRIVSEQYQRAEQMIRDNKESLEKIAQALLDYETIEGIHVQEIIEHGEIRTPVQNNLTTGTSTASKGTNKTPETAPETDPGAAPESAPAGAPA